MSQRKEKKERFKKNIENDILLAHGITKSFQEFLSNLPLDKAVAIECLAVDERTVQLPKDLGGTDLNLDFSYSKPENGFVALVLRRLPDGKIEKGIKSSAIFSRKATLEFDKTSDTFKNTNN